MATKPDLLKWVSSDDATRIFTVPQTKKDNGFLYLEKPAFQYINYLFNRIYKWFLGLQGSYAQVVVGSASQVTTKDATHTINQLNNTVVPTSTRVLVLEGNHVLTGNLSLSSANIQFIAENGNAVIDCDATYKLTISGARAKGVIILTDLPASGADVVTISGAGSEFLIADVPSNRLTVGAGAFVKALSTSGTSDAVLILNNIEIPRPRVLFTSSSDSITNKYNGAILVVDATGGVRTETLPTAASVKPGYTVGVMKGDGGNNVIAATSGGDLIRTTSSGVASVVLPGIGDLIMLESDGISAWIPIGGTNAPKTGTLTDGATINWNMANIESATVTIAGDRAFAAPTNQRAGKLYTLFIIQGGGGGFTPTFDAAYSGNLPYVKKTAGAVTMMQFVSDGTILRCTTETTHVTGDVKQTLRAAADDGWLAMNDTSIGNSASGATGRAHADTLPLFTVLWATSNSVLQIQDSSGTPTTKGATALQDFNNNRRMPLPKTLGRALANAGSGSGLTSRALGLSVGFETHTLTIPEMPVHRHNVLDLHKGAGTDGEPNRAAGQVDNGPVTTDDTGGGQAHNNMQPTVFLNIFIKL